MIVRLFSKALLVVLVVVLTFSEARSTPCSAPEIREKKGNEKKVVEVIAGNAVKLICQVNKDKDVSAYWLKNNKTLHPSDHHRMRIKANKYLKIKKAERANAGFYTCVAVNNCGRNEYTLQLLVRTAPRFTVPPEKLARNLLAFPVGNSVKLDCSADGYPRPIVTWYKDGALFQHRKAGRRLHLSPWTLLLTMKDLVPTDTGKYTCNVSNAYGWINHTYEVDVHKRVRAEPVVLPMQNVTVYVGDNATLLCKALSDSRPHFQWLRWFTSPLNGSTKSTIEHPHYELIKQQNEQGLNQHLVLPQSNNKFDFHGVKLTLVNVTKKDEGKYTCIVGNAVGYAVEQAYIIAFKQSDRQKRGNSSDDKQDFSQKHVNSSDAAPRFTVPPEKLARNLLAFPVGNSVKLDCSADGYPRPIVTWYKDGALFQHRKAGRRLHLSPWTLLLTMKDLVPTDTGKYTCNVSNAYGWINHTYEVDVHERVRAEPVVLPMQNVTVYVGDNATLLCKALSDSRPHFQWLRWFTSPLNGSTKSTIEHPHYELIKQQNEQGLNQHLVLPQSNNKFDFHGVKLTLVNVTKKDEGKYTCIVGNAVGYAVEQAYIIVFKQSDRQKRGNSSDDKQDFSQKHVNSSDGTPEVSGHRSEKPGNKSSGFQYPEVFIGMLVGAVILLAVAFGLCYWQIKKTRARSSAAESRPPEIDSLRAKHEVQNEYVVVPDFSRSI